MQVCGGILDDHTCFLGPGYDQHPVAVLRFNEENVGIAEVVFGILVTGGKGIFGNFGPVFEIFAGCVHDRFLRCVDVIMAGVEGVIQAVLSLDHTAGTQCNVLFQTGFRVRDHNAQIFIGTIVFRPHQCPGMIAGLAVSLVCQIKDIHLAVVIKRHRIAYKGEVKSWKQ